MVKSAELPVDSGWDMEIKPKSSFFNLNLKEFFRYSDLLWLLVRRDFVAFYKQTILGPIWIFIQPLLTTAMYFIIFTRVAKLQTDNVPPLLFYLAGITLWNYISESLTKTSDTFIANANIFGKVYFPRLIIPVSIVLSSLVRLGIQLCLFIAFWAYNVIVVKSIQPHWPMIFLLPVLVLMMAGLCLGLGVIFSSLTTKYRDLKFLLTFGIQLAMFATPIVYPLSLAPEKYRMLILINPFSAIVETFRYAFLGSGQFSWLYLGYSALATVIILTIGMLIFNRVEKNFMDTV